MTYLEPRVRVARVVDRLPVLRVVAPHRRDIFGYWVAVLRKPPVRAPTHDFRAGKQQAIAVQYLVEQTVPVLSVCFFCDGADGTCGYRPLRNDILATKTIPACRR